MKKNRTRVISFIICMILTIASAVSSVGCGPRVTEKLDKTKTQLYIGTYGGGYGTAFLQDLEDRFEKWALDNNKSYEEGKVGVQVYKAASKTKYTSSALVEGIASDKNEVYFVTSDSLQSFMANDSILEITDYVAVANPFDNNTKTIGSKLNLGMSEHHNVGTESQPRYYSLPFVDGGSGIAFDRDVFNANTLYFAKGSCPSEYDRRTSDEIIADGGVVPVGYAEPLSGSFTSWGENVASSEYDMDGNWIGDNELSAGPDGCYGTQDDGLPATLEEFGRLLTVMNDRGVYSITWSGQYETEYSPFLARAFANNYHGYAEASIRTDAGGATGRETTVVKMDSAGNALFGTDGKPLLERIKITKDNLQDVARQAGFYYGFKMFEMLLASGTVSPEVDQSLSHVDTQYRFIMSLPDQGKTDIAMLLDGCWWENEAASAGTYKDMVRYFGEEYARENRNFAYFPMPWVDASQIGNKMTIAGGGGSFFVSKARALDRNGQLVKGDLIKDFIQFAYSDESLQRMTVNIGLPSPFIYEMNGVNPDYNGTAQEGKTYYETMSSYTRSFYDYYKTADVFYGFTANIDTATNGKLTALNSIISYTSAVTASGKRFGTFPYAYGNKDLRATAKTYFEGMYRKTVQDLA